MNCIKPICRDSSVFATIALDFRCCLFAFLQLVILGVQSIALHNSDGGLHCWCQNACLFIALNIALQAASFQSIGKTLSLGSLFLICSYLVNCSYCILLAIDAQGSNSALMTLFLPRFGTGSFIEASRYALNCISCVSVGYFCASAIKFQGRHGGGRFIIRQDSTNKLRIFITGKYLTFVFGIIYFASTAVLVLMSFMSGNYASRVEAMNLPLMSDAVNLHPLFFAGLFLLMVHYKQVGRLKVSRRIMLFAVFCIVLSFFSGVRSRGTMQLVVLLSLWVACIDRPKPKTVLIGIALGLVLLQLMAAIRTVRAGGLSVESIASSFFSLDNGLLYEVLNEYGGSLFATSGLMNWVDEIHPIDFFVRQIGTVLPGISSWGGEIFLSPTVRTGFEDVYHLGSTYVADVFYYFGSAGPFISGCLGYWIALLDKYVWGKTVDGNYIAVAAAMPGMLSVFNSTRASIDFGFKMFLYSAAIIYLFSLLSSRERIDTRNASLFPSSVDRD